MRPLVGTRNVSVLDRVDVNVIDVVGVIPIITN